MLNEQLSRPQDKVHQLSHGEIKQRQKKRAEKLKEKYGISENIETHEIIEKEGKIREAHESSVQEVEKESDKAEGNISEQLIKAAESGNDGDIVAAIASARHYHKTSDDSAKQIIYQLQQKKIGKLFAVNDNRKNMKAAA